MKLKIIFSIVISLILFSCSTTKKIKPKVITITMYVPDGWKLDTLTVADKLFLDSLDRSENKTKQ